MQRENDEEQLGQQVSSHHDPKPARSENRKCDSKNMSAKSAVPVDCPSSIQRTISFHSFCCAFLVWPHQPAELSHTLNRIRNQKQLAQYDGSEADGLIGNRFHGKFIRSVGRTCGSTRQFPQIRSQNRLRATPDKEKHALSNGPLGRVTAHVTRSFGCSQPALSGSQDQ